MIIIIFSGTFTRQVVLKNKILATKANKKSTVKAKRYIETFGFSAVWNTKSLQRAKTVSAGGLKHFFAMVSSQILSKFQAAFCIFQPMWTYTINKQKFKLWVKSCRGFRWKPGRSVSLFNLHQVRGVLSPSIRLLPSEPRDLTTQHCGCLGRFISE